MSKLHTDLDQQNKSQGLVDDEVLRIFERMKKFDGSLWASLVRAKANVPVGTLAAPDPGLELIKRQKKGVPGIFVGPSQDRVSLRRVTRPLKQKSFGFVGTFAKLVAKEQFIDGTLALRFEPKKLGHVDATTLRIFHWDSEQGRYQRIPGSRLSLDGQYVWARVSRPGDYALIGINTHPQVLWTLRAASALSGFSDAMPPALREHIRQTLCRVILCAPDVSNVIANERIASRLRDLMHDMDASPPEQLPGAGGIDYCNLCLGDEGELPPEIDMMEEPLGTPSCRETWESIGPNNISGSIADIAIDPAHPSRVFVAAHDGGIWTHENVEWYPVVTFQPLTDDYENLRMRTVAVSRGGTVYAGRYMGDDLARLIRSQASDRWRVWSDRSEVRDPVTLEVRSWEEHKSINRILLDPSDENRVFLASKDGFKYSWNGGEGWHRLVEGDVLDAAQDPENGTIFYLAVRDQGFVKCTVNLEGLEARVTDNRTVLSLADARILVEHAGQHWRASALRVALGHRRLERTSEGSMRTVSEGASMRTVVAKSGENHLINRAAGEGGPAAWQVMADASIGGDQNGWDNCLAVDPHNNDIIMTGNIGISRSTTGGRDWEPEGGFGHQDRHRILFDSTRPGRVLVAEDTGVYQSMDHGTIFRELNRGLVTLQALHVAPRSFAVTASAVVVCDHSHVLGQIGSTRDWADVGNFPPQNGGFNEHDLVFSHPALPNRWYGHRNEGLYRVKREGGGWVRSKLGNFDSQNHGHLATAVGFAPFDRAMLCAEQPHTHSPAAFHDPPDQPNCRLMFTSNCEPDHPDPWADPWETLAEWHPVLHSPPNDPFVSAIFVKGDPSVRDVAPVYAMTETGHLFYLKLSPRDVASPLHSEPQDLRPLPSGSAVQMVLGPKLLAISHDGLWRREIEEGEFEWEALRPPAIGEYRSLIVLPYPHDEHIVLLGTDVGLFGGRISADSFIRNQAGEIGWNRIDDGLPHVTFQQLILGGSNLYAATYGRGVWRRNICSIT